MPKSDPLFELIQSLSPAEKKYFTRFAGRYRTARYNIYARLFEILSKQEVYDERQVLAHLRPITTKDKLSVHKNQLYAQILKCLRQYHAGATVKIRLQELLIECQILLEKGLNTQAMRLIKKGKKLANQYHYDALLVELELIERRLNRRFIGQKTIERIDELQLSTQSTLANYQVHLQILACYERAFLLIRNRAAGEQEMELLKEQMDLFQFQLDLESLTFEAKVYFHLFYFLYHEWKAEHLLSFDHSGKILELFEREPVMISEDPERYLGHLSNHLNSCFRLKKLDIFPDILFKMESIKAEGFELQAKLFQQLYYQRLLYHLSLFDYPAVVRMAPNISEGIEKYKKALTKSRILTFYYNTAIAFFVEGFFTQALEWIQSILNEPKQDERQDIQTVCRLLQVAIHYELGNHGVVEYLVQSVARYLRRLNLHDSIEYKIIKCVKDAVKNLPSKRQLLFQRLIPHLNQVVGYEEFKIWAERNAKKHK